MYGRIQENVVHRHNAIQLVWPESAASLTVDGTQCVAAAVIASRIPHQLTMDRGWVLLIEPHSALGHALTARLTGTPYVVLDEVALYQGSLSMPDETLDYPEPAFDVLPKMLAPLLSALGVQRLFEQLLLQHLSMVDGTSETSHPHTVTDSARLDKRYKLPWFICSSSFLLQRLGRLRISCWWTPWQTRWGCRKVGSFICFENKWA